MPNWKKVVTSGSNAELNTLNLSGVVNANADTDKFLVLDSAGNVDFRTGTQIFSDIGASTMSSSLASRITSNDGDISSNTNAISTLNGKTLVSGSSQITISSTTGYTTFSSSIADDIAGLQGAGYVDTSGTPSNNQLAIFTDSNTIEGVDNVKYDNTSFTISGSKFVVDAKFDPSSAVSLGMGGNEYLTIDATNGLQTVGGFTSTGQIGVFAGAGQSFGANGLEINNAANANVDATIRLAANSLGASGAEAFWTFGIKATDNSHDFVFTNYSNISGVGVPDPAFTISKATNQVKIGSLVVSGSGTFKNIGPAQFSGSISITTANQVAATVDTDKFLVIDGQQIKYRSGTEILSDINGVSTNTTQTITGIKTFSSDTTFNGDVIVGGRITAQEFNTEFVSSSIIFSSGSTKFGDSSDDSHDFTGSLNVNGGITIWNLNDPQLTFAGSGLASSIAMGIDDSDSDKFKISRSSTLGSSDIYKYNYNGGNQNHTFAGDLVLTNSNVGLTGGQLVKINSSGFLVPAVANTDYVPTGSTPDIYVIHPVQTYIDFKGLTSGGLPWGGITDPQPIDRAFGVWIAPAAGYIEKIYVSPENSNSNQDNMSIQLYVDGGTQGSAQTNLLGSAGTNTEFTFGAGSYSFTEDERIYLFLDKNTNDSDLYAVQVVFRVNNQ